MPRRRKKKWGKKPLRRLRIERKKPEVDWNKRFRDAVRLNDWKQVMWLVEEKGVKVPLDRVDILHSAIDRCDVLEFLLEHGANINAKQIGWRGGGETVLHTAVLYESYLEQVKLLIRYGADVNARADDGSTPLHCACKSATVILVRNGANVNAKANDGRTPLNVAVHTDWPVSLLLVCLGARIDSISRKVYKILDHIQKELDLLKNGKPKEVRNLCCLEERKFVYNVASALAKRIKSAAVSYRVFQIVKYYITFY